MSEIEMINKCLFSSNSDEYETPQALFDELDKEFCFDIDVCGTDEKHKCKTYYTKEQNGLLKKWGGYRCFCNPPYSQIELWVEKAFRETRNDNTIVVMLIPSRTDTRYFHNYIYQRAEIRFIKGRLHFNNSGSAPFPSMLVIFRGANIKEKR